MSLLTLNRTYRNLQRFQVIVNVFLRHGFGEIVERMGLSNLVSLGRRVVTFNRYKEPERPQLSTAQRFRLALEELGPCFIKFGQILSSRPDILPEEMIVELKRLQENVPPFSFAEVRAAVEEELGKPLESLFAEVESTPHASASIGQVHFARLKSGEPVVVKVQRPGIEAIIATDIDILINLAQLLERYITESRQYQPVALVEEFAESIRRELDFRLEASHTERFARNFAGDPRIRVPTVYWELTTRKVLTLERLEGIPIDRADLLVEAGLDPREIAETGGLLFLTMFLDHGFFHADHHPRNIFVLPDGTIAMVDFGMVGRLEEEQMEALADLLVALLAQDYERMVQELINLGYEIPEEALKPIRADLRDLIEPYYGRAIQELELGHFVSRIVEMVAKRNVRVPTEFLMLTRALVIMEGVGRQLNPELDLVRLAAPLAAEILRKKYSPRRMARDAYRTAGEFKELFRQLPKQIGQLLKRLNQGELQIDVVHRRLDEVTRELDRLGNRLTLGLIISALIIGSSLIMLSSTPPFLFGFPALGILGYAMAGVMGIWLIIAIFKSGRL